MSTTRFSRPHNFIVPRDQYNMQLSLIKEMDQTIQKSDASFAQLQTEATKLKKQDFLKLSDKEYYDSIYSKTVDGINNLGTYDFSSPVVQAKILGTLGTVLENKTVDNAIKNDKKVLQDDERWNKVMTDPKLKGAYSDAYYDKYLTAREDYLKDKTPGASFNYNFTLYDGMHEKLKKELKGIERTTQETVLDDYTIRRLESRNDMAMAGAIGSNISNSPTLKVEYDYNLKKDPNYISKLIANYNSQRKNEQDNLDKINADLRTFSKDKKSETYINALRLKEEAENHLSLSPELTNKDPEKLKEIGYQLYTRNYANQLKNEFRAPSYSLRANASGIASNNDKFKKANYDLSVIKEINDNLHFNEGLDFQKEKFNKEYELNYFKAVHDGKVSKDHDDLNSVLGLGGYGSDLILTTPIQTGFNNQPNKSFSEIGVEYSKKATDDAVNALTNINTLLLQSAHPEKYAKIKEILNSKGYDNMTEFYGKGLSDKVIADLNSRVIAIATGEKLPDLVTKQLIENINILTEARTKSTIYNAFTRKATIDAIRYAMPETKGKSDDEAMNIYNNSSSAKKDEIQGYRNETFKKYGLGGLTGKYEEGISNINEGTDKNNLKMKQALNTTLFASKSAYSENNINQPVDYPEGTVLANTDFLSLHREGGKTYVKFKVKNAKKEELGIFQLPVTDAITNMQPSLKSDLMNGNLSLDNIIDNANNQDIISYAGLDKNRLMRIASIGDRNFVYYITGGSNGVRKITIKNPYNSNETNTLTVSSSVVNFDRWIEEIYIKAKKDMPNVDDKQIYNEVIKILMSKN